MVQLTFGNGNFGESLRPALLGFHFKSRNKASRGSMRLRKQMYYGNRSSDGKRIWLNSFFRANPIRKTHATKLQQINGQASYTTQALTPPDYSLLVVVVTALSLSNDIRSNSTMTSSPSLLWTRQKTVGVQNGSPTAVLELWTAPVITAASMTITFTPTATADFYDIAVYSVVGGRSTVGATGSLTTFASDTTPIVLDAAPALTSIVFAARHHSPQNDETTTAAAAIDSTESYESYLSNWGGMSVQERRGSTSTDVPWADVNEAAISTFWQIGIAVEIVLVASSSTFPTPTRFFTMRR